MKIIEFLSENEDDWTTIQHYSAGKIPTLTSNKKSLDSFLRKDFPDELKKLIQFLNAWESLARSHKYPHKYAEAANKLAGKLITTLANSGIISSNFLSEDLAQENLDLTKEKFENFALYYGSIGHDFDEMGESTLAKFNNRLSYLLKNAAKELNM